MIDIGSLPAVNAALNGTSAVLASAGFYFIRRRDVARHRACMLAAFATSALFLVSYLVYHYHHGATPFPGQGWSRPLYFSILISHTALAVTVVPLILGALYMAWRQDFERHRRLTRWALPIWLYVSVTGVAVYCLLYQVFRAV